MTMKVKERDQCNKVDKSIHYTRNWKGVTGVNLQDIICIAVSAGCEVIEYENYFCLRKETDVCVLVTIPKTTYLLTQLFEKIRDALGL